MQIVIQNAEIALRSEVIRYLLNGVFATAVHFSILTINIELFQFRSAAFANILAAICGITVSFLGSRYFVFKGHRNSISEQAIVFAILYVSIACLHGIVLYYWTDIYRLDYRIGFLLATFIQVASSYIGNKYLVFKK